MIFFCELLLVAVLLRNQIQAVHAQFAVSHRLLHRLAMAQDGGKGEKVRRRSGVRRCPDGGFTVLRPALGGLLAPWSVGVRTQQVQAALGGGGKKQR
jgi:hypothetical protein